MREKLIDIVEAYADFLDWDTKEEMVYSIMEFLATDNNVGHKWIPVKERLPEFGNRVIATDGVVVGEMYISNMKNWYRYTGVSWRLFADTRITHWMPLPEPPKGE